MRRVARVAELGEPAIERVEVPWREGRLVGWLYLPPSGRAAATVVVWGGRSGWGAAYLGAADVLTARGLACLHGGADPLVPDGAVQAPFAEAAGDLGELRMWPDDEHTLNNHARERDAALGDWFSDHLAHD